MSRNRWKASDRRHSGVLIRALAAVSDRRLSAGHTAVQRLQFTDKDSRKQARLSSATHVVPSSASSTIVVQGTRHRDTCTVASLRYVAGPCHPRHV